MAFDGPSPFDGDPAFDLLTEFEEAPEDAEAILEEALLLPLENEYVDVDMGVHAWAAAELVAAHACGGATVPLPDAFEKLRVSDVSDLVPRALESLERIAQEASSELAELLRKGDGKGLSERLSGLRARLRTAQTADPSV